MAIMKARLFPSLLIFIIFSSCLLLIRAWPLTFGDETLSSTTEYDIDCIARVCEGANGIDLENCKDNYSGYCESVPDYKKPMSKLAQCQRRCEEMREPRERQQCQSRCLRQHQQYQQCMQICQGSVTIAARPTEITELCREICLEEQGNGYYLSLWFSNPDHDKEKCT